VINIPGVIYNISYNIGRAINNLKSLGGALSNVGRRTSDVSKGVQGLGQRSKLDLMAMAGAFQTMGAVAQGVFSNIIEQSPSMGLAFAQMEFSVNRVYLAIGEALAPIIMETLVPAIETLTNWFIGLNPNIQALIGLTIGLTVAGGMLAVAIITIQTVGAPLIAIILGIALAIAGLILIWRNDFLGIRTKTTEMFQSFTPLFDTFKGSLGGLGEAFSDLFELVAPAMKIFVDIMGDYVQMLVANFMAKINLIVTVLTEVINIIVAIARGDWSAVWEAFSNIIDAFVDYFRTKWENLVGFLDKVVQTLFGMNLSELGGIIADFIGDIINMPINWINNSVIGSINGILNTLAGYVDKIPGVGRPNWAIPTIPTFAEGGFMPFTGLAFLHQGERVLNPQETQAFTMLQTLGIPAQGGGGGSTSQPQPIIIQNEITIDGGIFLDRSTVDDLTDLLSEKLLEKVQRSINGV